MVWYVLLQPLVQMIRPWVCKHNIGNQLSAGKDLSVNTNDGGAAPATTYFVIIVLGNVGKDVGAGDEITHSKKS
jgi:hypothetical protein